jgi:hypothetical protein
MLDNILAEQLSPIKSDKDSSFFKYELKWEKSPDVSEGEK